MDESRVKLYSLRRTDFGFHGKTTEKAQTGGWGKGPGNNVSDTMRGVNNAHNKAIALMGERAKARNPGKMKERARRKLERKHA